MRKIESLVEKYTSPTTEYLDGQFKNNPGDDSGSAVVAETQNDVYYAFAQFIKAFRPNGLSNTPESSLVSDFVDAFERASDRRNDYGNQWNVTTAYQLGDEIFYCGCRFVCQIAGTGLNPITSGAWLCVAGNDLLQKFTNAELINNTMSAIHQIDNESYQTLFSLGTHVIGDSKTRKTLKFWGLHIDGSEYTDNTKLTTLLNAYFTKSTIANDSNVSDFKDKFPRATGTNGGSVGNTGGDAIRNITG